jgi:hypothetical protein
MTRNDNRCQQHNRNLASPFPCYRETNHDLWLSKMCMGKDDPRNFCPRGDQLLEKVHVSGVLLLVCYHFQVSAPISTIQRNDAYLNINSFGEPSAPLQRGTSFLATTCFLLSPFIRSLHQEPSHYQQSPLMQPFPSKAQHPCLSGSKDHFTASPPRKYYSQPPHSATDPHHYNPYFSGSLLSHRSRQSYFSKDSSCCARMSPLRYLLVFSFLLYFL